jgi:hypothetical protein
MDSIASAQRIAAELVHLNCGPAEIARYVEISVEAAEQLIKGNGVEIGPRTLRRLERLQRLLHARVCVDELMWFGVREKEIAKRAGVRKETITHIHRDPYWSVGPSLLNRLKTTLLNRRLELFERLLPGLEIQPFQTSGRPTNRRGWSKRAERIRGAMLKAYGGSPLTLRGRDFEGIIAKLGAGEEMILIWARDARTLLHEANHLVEFAEQKVSRGQTSRTKTKDLMRICK